MGQPAGSAAQEAKEDGPTAMHPPTIDARDEEAPKQQSRAQAALARVKASAALCLTWSRFGRSFELCPHVCGQFAVPLAD